MRKMIISDDVISEYWILFEVERLGQLHDSKSIIIKFQIHYSLKHKIIVIIISNEDILWWKLFVSYDYYSLSDFL